jgi:hypothetical protein
MDETKPLLLFIYLKLFLIISLIFNMSVILQYSYYELGHVYGQADIVACLKLASEHCYE